MPLRHIGRVGGITPLILKLGSSWRWVLNFTLQQLYTWERTLVPNEWEVGGFQNQSGHFGEEKYSLPLPWFKPMSIQPVTSLLYWLNSPGSHFYAINCVKLEYLNLEFWELKLLASMIRFVLRLRQLLTTVMHFDLSSQCDTFWIEAKAVVSQCDTLVLRLRQLLVRVMHFVLRLRQLLVSVMHFVLRLSQLLVSVIHFVLRLRQLLVSVIHLFWG